MIQKIKDFLFKNTNAKQTVAKNTIWLSISNFGGRMLKAVIVIYAARILGAADYGIFSYAVTLAAFFSIFVDPGINAVLMREGAKASAEERQTLFSTTAVMKAAIIAASVAVVIWIAPFFSTLPGARALLPLVALIIVFDNAREFLASYFRAQEKMQWEAGSFILENFAIVAFGFVFLEMSATAAAFTWAYVVGSMLGAIAAAWLARESFKKMLNSVSLRRMGGIVKTAWPFAIIGALGVLLTSTDILIISWTKDAATVGIYSAAIRIIQALYLIPGIIQLSTLPLFARLAKSDPARFRAVLERTVALIFLISIPLCLGGAILGSQIMSLVFGAAYAAGGIALSVLMLNLSFDYAGSVISNGIFAYDHQKSLIICSVIGGFGNVLFDLLFIPRWGMTGSAFATLIAQILSNAYLWYAMKKLNPFSIAPRLKRIGLAGAAMACITAGLMFAGVSVIPNILVSAVAYVGILFLTREPLLRDLKNITALGQSPA